MPEVKSAGKLLHELEVETATGFVMYYSYGVQLGELWLREGMLNGGMQECRGYRATKMGRGIQKLSYCSIF